MKVSRKYRSKGSCSFVWFVVNHLKIDFRGCQSQSKSLSASIHGNQFYHEPHELVFRKPLLTFKSRQMKKGHEDFPQISK